jgi:hypothetical protein
MTNNPISGVVTDRPICHVFCPDRLGTSPAGYRATLASRRKWSLDNRYVVSYTKTD